MQKHYYNLRFQSDENEWRARAKRFLIFQSFKKYQKTGRADQIKMLDFGCGSGLLQTEFEQKFPNITAFGIDVSKEAIFYSKKRGLKRVSIFSGKRIPFASNTFDLVTAIDVLEHIKDDMKALTEIRRVLKRGGLGIFLVPAHQELYSTRDIRLHHVRRYDKGELEDKCRRLKYKISASKNVDFLLYFILLFMCRKAQKLNGVPHLERETAEINSLTDGLLFGYEVCESIFLRYFNFPTGISVLTVVNK